MPKYYPINEETARRAKNANSFSDYVPGSATAAYREMVDRADAIGGQQKGRVDPMYHEKIDGLIDLSLIHISLFLWATFPQLPEALRLIEAWGFRYKSVAFVWLKKNKKADSWFYGLGFWTRGNAEICLLATKGHPKRKAANIHQFIISPIEAHSKKPDEAREKIVALMGDLPRVELFARQSPPGWEVWGNEVESTIPDFGTKCPKDAGAGKEADPCPM